MKKSGLRRVVELAIATMTTCGLSSAASAQSIGAVSALNRDVQGTPPAAEARTLAIGDRLFSEEFIESSPIGSGQFLFLDQTSLTIAKNSSLVLDKYVYDPETRTGEIAISMTRGVLRFIGGRITKTTDAVITTPTATIGIRGGMAVVIAKENGETVVMHIAGEYTKVTTLKRGGSSSSRTEANASEAEESGGQSADASGGSTLARSGESGPAATSAFEASVDVAARADADSEVILSRGNGVAVAGSGGVAFVGVADRELVRETTVALTGRGDAGALIKPLEADISESGLPSTNSEAKGVRTAAPISTSGERFRELDVQTEDDGDRLSPAANEEIALASLTSSFEIVPAEESAAEPQAPEPLAPVAALTLLPTVTGAAFFSSSDVFGLTSGGGQTFVFESVFDGSRVGVTAAGDRFSIPTSEGFFAFDATAGSSPLGPIAGGGFFSESPDFTFSVFQTEDGATGAFVAGEASAPLPIADGGRRIARSYSLSDDLFTQNGAPFTSAGLNGFGADGRSDLVLLSNAGGAATGGDAKALATYLEINGLGSAQTSGLGVLTADVEAAAAGTPKIDGLYEGFFQTAENDLLRIETPVATLEDGRGATAFGADAQFLALSNGDGVSGAADPGRAISQTGAVELFGANTLASRAGETSLAAQSAPARMNGFAAATGRDLSTGDLFTGAAASADLVEVNVDAERNIADAKFSFPAFFRQTEPGGNENSFVANQNFNSATLSFGGPDDRSAAMDRERFALRASASEDVLASRIVGRSSLQTTSEASAFSAALASSDLAGDGGVFPNDVPATSAFLTWGWWAGEFRGGDAQSAVGAEPLNDQRFHLGAWIAGDIVNSLPAVGIATYDGFAIATADVNGRNVVDGAGFSLAYDFATANGAAAFTDLFGLDVSVTVARDGSAPLETYAGVNIGGFNIDGEPGNLVVRGSFFSEGADAPNATAGAFQISNLPAGIVGSGVFGADLTSFEPGD